RGELGPARGSTQHDYPYAHRHRLPLQWRCQYEVEYDHGCWHRRGQSSCWLRPYQLIFQRANNFGGQLRRVRHFTISQFCTWVSHSSRHFCDECDVLSTVPWWANATLVARANACVNDTSLVMK